ncbi:hypothetical protein BAZ12_09760 [Elizabethkingia miricola]|uniref:Glycosyl-4,4'-diaponeurosporenoate acyltransferase n=1 Tax=Elizabethkingia miricola TaxID=172045 RepID=A0ABD4DPD5_ELIMR|nr:MULTISPECIES: hypothetical protein [Elizabethkingia]KUY20250.1 hypothetical protein ATB95_04885 [Elizabethkingia miricola]MCL1653574.1 hypothetical protein [Elizabethkingia miricola]OPC70078.1 hypothetical protein BAZ12_09760 [Elizabethkingia miricola]OPC74009.1 hypothetical protein BAZ13_03030 [Elizabethkingia miricola]QCO45570.1 hypothetical protein FCS00_03995 [Elizabethkingia sp. 2-6]
MKIILAYLMFSISITFISWIVGMIINALLKKTVSYNQELVNFNFIKSEKLNKAIGIGVIKWIVKNTFFKFFNPKIKFDRNVNLTELKTIRNEMTKSEIEHLIAFVFASFFAIIKFYNHNYLFCLIIMIVNILMNLYPSLLQQQNKRRIDKLEIKFQK